jgi:hypothetical protein
MAVDSKYMAKVVAIHTVTFVVNYTISRALGSVLRKRFVD